MSRSREPGYASLLPVVMPVGSRLPTSFDLSLHECASDCPPGGHRAMTEQPKTQAGRAFLASPDKAPLESWVLAIEAEAYDRARDDAGRALLRAEQSEAAAAPAAAEPSDLLEAARDVWMQEGRYYEKDGSVSTFIAVVPIGALRRLQAATERAERAAQPLPCPECGATYGR